MDEVVIIGGPNGAIGGPNGAGKTTFALEHAHHRPEIREFVNADLIAEGLWPLAPDQAAIAAGRLMLKRIRELINARQSFAFETTLAGRSYLPLLKQCKADDWRVTLVYLWLPSPQYAIERVARRVQQGGHNIPSDVVERRYRTGLSNMLRLYLPLADVIGIYDNSDGGRRLVAYQRERGALIKRDADRWSALQTWAERTRP